MFLSKNEAKQGDIFFLCYFIILILYISKKFSKLLLLHFTFKCPILSYAISCNEEEYRFKKNVENHVEDKKKKKVFFQRSNKTDKLSLPNRSFAKSSPFPAFSLNFIIKTAAMKRTTD